MRKGEFDNEMTPAPRERKTKSATEALQSLMRLCARGERSTGDAMRLMRTWGVPEGERQGVVDKLVAQRFIDNSRYAELYVREKSRLDHRSNVARHPPPYEALLRSVSTPPR